MREENTDGCHSTKRIGAGHAQVRRTGWPPVTEALRTRKDAETWARDVESQMDRGVFVDRSAMARRAEARAPVVAGTDLWLAEAAILTSAMDGSPQCGLLQRNHPKALDAAERAPSTTSFTAGASAPASNNGRYASDSD
jgi:hypothetical protein